ncbi:hypothetical protein LOK49_LG12G01413 [Camellia lanceoleosa]|uniref:Uncharacterized protein n=1 Tax=Camellia lanceoleosa TaxID=1840588 RepID=A0ACC0FXH6_9ERIC|nr:hypothetical protein LOK49_LG12G01413 [Camellia lanceoleosa]
MSEASLVHTPLSLMEPRLQGITKMIGLYCFLWSEIILYMINPFYCFVGEEMMVDLKLPLKPNQMYSILLPIVVFLFFYIRRNNVYDLHHSILGLLFAVLITGVLTDAIKDAVGRPRPDFFWCCFPDGIPRYDDKWGNVICHGNPIDIKEGYKSFLSGHTSCKQHFLLICLNFYLNPNV